jgi:hypothetical protein
VHLAEQQQPGLVERLARGRQRGRIDRKAGNGDVTLVDSPLKLRW